MLSRGEGDVSVDVLESIAYTISIHALRVEGDIEKPSLHNVKCISIHVLRVEGDITIRYEDGTEKISIHALRVEGDVPRTAGTVTGAQFLSTPSGWRATRRRVNTVGAPEFLSTPSGWRATKHRYGRCAVRGDFYPRPPGGGRLKPNVRAVPRPRISIHALRVEGDGLPHARKPEIIQFLSTPSGWRAT